LVIGNTPCEQSPDSFMLAAATIETLNKRVGFKDLKGKEP